MEKVQIALAVLTIAIMVGPLAYMAFTYRDNLIGLVLPPQLGGIVNNNEELFDLENITSIASDFQPPKLTNEPIFFPENDSYALAFNFTNPIAEEISVDSFTAAVYSKDGVLLGNVSLGSPINIGPNESGIIDIAGGWTQSAMDYLNSHSDADTLDVTFKDIDIGIAGLEFQLDELPPGLLDSIPLPVGVLPHEG